MRWGGHPWPSEDPETTGRVVRLEAISPGYRGVGDGRWSGPWSKMKLPTLSGGRGVMEQKICPGFGVPGCDAGHPLPPPSGTARGARGTLGAVWSCAPTTHLAACYPVCCRPRPSPWAARPPAQNRKGKEVISIVSGSPEKLPSSEWAGGIPGAGDQIKAGPRERPPPPPALACLRCVSFP